MSRLARAMALLAPLALSGRAWAAPFMWCGGVTDRAAAFRVRAPSDTTFQVSASRAFDPVVFDADVAAGEVARLNADGLEPNTDYFYRLRTSDGDVGRFKTFGRNGTDFDFRFAFASCASTGSNAEVFETIVGTDPLFFVHMGDLHYMDIEENSTARYAEGYYSTQEQENQRSLFRGQSVVYMFDDHDFGANNADGANTVGRVSAQQAYRTHVGHYPLHNPAAGAVYHSFVVGRVLFIVTDLRSDSALPGDLHSTMGRRQTDWFRALLRDRAPHYRLVVWVNTKPWIGAVDEDEDEKWYASRYADERGRIADMIAELNVTNLISVAGDAHMLAFDDGSYSDYSDKGPAGFPVFQAAAMDRTGSVKGGPFSHGCATYRLWTVHQFGVMDVSFTDDSTCLSWRGYRGNEVVMSWSKCARDGAFVVEGSAGWGACSAPLFPPAVWVGIVAGVTLLATAAASGATLYAVRQTRRKGQLVSGPVAAEAKGSDGDVDRSGYGGARRSGRVSCRAARASGAEEGVSPDAPLTASADAEGPRLWVNGGGGDRGAPPGNGCSYDQGQGQGQGRLPSRRASCAQVPPHVQSAQDALGFSRSNPLLQSTLRTKSAKGPSQSGGRAVRAPISSLPTAL